MTTSELGGTSALVTGATRGFGRAIAVALHNAGANVAAVARNAERLCQLRSELGGSLATVAADAADPVVAGSLIEQYRPKTLVLNAGAAPLMRPLQHQTWQTFSRNGEVDVRLVFHWIREALLVSIYSKLGASDRSSAVRQARELRLLAIGRAASPPK